MRASSHCDRPKGLWQRATAHASATPFDAAGTAELHSTTCCNRPSHHPRSTPRATCNTHHATRIMQHAAPCNAHHTPHGRAAPYPLLAAIAADARASAAARACGAVASTLGPTGCGLKLAGDVAGRCAGALAGAGARPASSAEASRRRAGRERGRRYSDAALQPHTNACETQGCRTLYRAAACRALSAGAAGRTELALRRRQRPPTHQHATPSCCGITGADRPPDGARAGSGFVLLTERRLGRRTN